MDPRIYTYEYRKPRLNNPTFISNNVTNSISFYHNDQIISSPKANNGYQIQQNYLDQQRQSSPSNKIQKQNGSYQMNKNKSAFVNTINKINPGDYNNSNNQEIPTDQKLSTDLREKSNSNLSNYGSNVLNTSNYHGSLYNQKQIYNKQQKKYNIITMKQKPYNQTIKQYPKLTLEDQDIYFYKRLDMLQKKSESLSKNQKASEESLNNRYN